MEAVIWTLLFGREAWKGGQRGFYAAMKAVSPESGLTPWLVARWLSMVLEAFRRAHLYLRQRFDLSAVRTSSVAWVELDAYFSALPLTTADRWGPRLRALVDRFARTTTRFFFGTPSQDR